MKAEQPYNFPEQSAWHLEQRLNDLLETQQLQHGAERRATIGRELSHLMFELNWRQEQCKNSIPTPT